jgi:hypothetical protein
MNMILLITIIIIFIIGLYLLSCDSTNYENYKEINYAPYNDINGIYANPPKYYYSYIPVPTSLFWNSTRNTRNMIYDIRGNPFYPNF